MQVSEQIIAVLDDLAQRFGVVIDWGQQNVLPYIQELCGKYISWEIATSIAWIIICAIPLIICGVVAIAKRDDWEGIDYVIMGLIASLPCVVICIEVFDIIKCCMFPELQVFEFIKGMMTGTP